MKNKKIDLKIQKLETKVKERMAKYSLLFYMKENKMNKCNDGRYKPYLKILRPNKNLDKAVKYFEDPLGFYFHKKGDYINPKVRLEEHYKRSQAYKDYLKIK